MNNSLANLSFKKLSAQYRKSDTDRQNKIIVNLINHLEFDKALTLIGDLSKLDDKKETSFNGLKRYIYLALIKNALMSHKSFVEMMDEVVEEILRREIPRNNLIVFISAILSNYRTAGIFPANVQIVEELKNCDSTSVNLMFCLFELRQLSCQGIIKSHDNRDYYEIFEDFKSAAVDKKLFDGFLYNAHLFTYVEKSFFGTMDDELYKKIFKYFDQSDFKKLYGCNYNFLLGEYEKSKGNDQKALEYFNLSLNLNPTATELSYIIFYKYIVNPASCSVQEIIFLRCAPIATPSGIVSYNLFTHYSARRHPINVVYKPYLEVLKKDPLEKNCWYFDSVEKLVTRENYQLLGERKNCLDFYSGIYRTESKLKIIPKHKLNALKIIFGSSIYGAHEILLIDMVYEQKFFQCNSGKLRIKNLINQLNKLGIYIYRKNNRYFYDFEKNKLNVIFPIDHQSRGILALIAKDTQNLSLKSLMRDYRIKKSTGSSYIRNWKLRGLIKESTKENCRHEYEIDTAKLFHVERFFESMS